MTCRSRGAVSAAALVLAAAPALADDKDDRIKKLEEETAELRKAVQELKDQRAVPDDDAAIRAAVDHYLARSGKSDEAPGRYAGPGGVLRPGGKITLGGYFSTRYLSAEENGTNSFQDMRLVPQLHAEITDRIAFNTEIEWEHGGITDEHGGEISVEYAELAFRFNDAFKFKVGTLLVPFGAFNQSHDDPINEMSSRPTVDRFVVPAALSGPGAGAEGALEMTDDASLTYDVVVNNGFSDNISSDEGLRTARTLFEEDDNHDKTVFTRVAVVPTVPHLDALNVGVSGALGKIGAQSDRLRGYGFDASSKAGPWEFKGEYDAFGIDRTGEGPAIDAAGNLGPTSGLYGWYGQLLYRFTDPWVRSLPFAEKDASFALVLRRDMVDLNERVHGASPQDDERAWSFGVTYRPTGKTAIKIEYRRASSGAPGSEGRERDLFAVEFATYF
jgi:hypothetical protein